MRYEVRCYCTPGKLLGWLEAPEGVDRWSWPVLGSIREFRFTDAAVRETRVTLPIDVYRDRQGARRAVKADGVPIEQLRNLYTFEEKR